MITSNAASLTWSAESYRSLLSRLKGLWRALHRWSPCVAKPVDGHAVAVGLDPLVAVRRDIPMARDPPAAFPGSSHHLTISCASRLQVSLHVSSTDATNRQLPRVHRMLHEVDIADGLRFAHAADVDRAPTILDSRALPPCMWHVCTCPLAATGCNGVLLG